MRQYKKAPKPEDLVFTVVPGQKPKKVTVPKRRGLTHEKNMQIANFFRGLQNVPIARKVS